jgi:hypothetical protein
MVGAFYKMEKDSYKLKLKLESLRVFVNQEHDGFMSKEQEKEAMLKLVDKLKEMIENE